jgi:hypothetical protein
MPPAKKGVLKSLLLSQLGYSAIFGPGWPAGTLILKLLGFSAWVRSAILPTWLRSGHFAVPPFCGQLLLDQSWPGRPQPKPSIEIIDVSSFVLFEGCPAGLLPSRPG